MPTKSARLNLRTTREQLVLIRKAAEAQRKTISEFILDSACRSAESTLLDARTMILDRLGWKQLNDELAREAREIPQLTDLFREKPPWD